MVEIEKAGNGYQVNDGKYFISCSSLERAEYIRDNFDEYTEEYAKKELEGEQMLGNKPIKEGEPWGREPIKVIKGGRDK